MLPEIASARRLLIIRPDNIGDIVMLTPALRALRAALPGTELMLMASPAGAAMEPLLPWIDRVLVRRTLWQDAQASLAFDPEREWAFVRGLRAYRFDAAIVFTSFSQTPHVAAYACYLAGIPVRVGQARDFAGGVLSHPITPSRDEVHQVDRNLHLLNALDIPVTRRDTGLVIPGSALMQAQEALSSVGVDGDYIALAPGASCEARTYDAARYAEVAKDLAAKLDLPVVLLGTARDASRAPALARMRQRNVVSLLGCTDIGQMAAILAGAALVICNNSAPMHIADAFRRPIVALYAGTDLRTQWWPRQSSARVLGQIPECAPCYGFTCRHDMECLDVSPTEVVQAAGALLAGRVGTVKEVTA